MAGAVGIGRPSSVVMRFGRLEGGNSEDVRRAMRRYAAPMRYCYERGLRADPGLPGEARPIE